MTELSYLYCLVRSRRRPALPVDIDVVGIPGGHDTRAVSAGDDLWLIAATVPESHYGEAALAKGLQNLDWVAPRALAHEAVVEQFLSAAAVLPMQMFTLFTSDARALQHVTRQRRQVLRILTRLERKHEWGLRVTFDEQIARSRLAPDRPVGTSTPRSTGSAYLASKRDLLDVTRGRLVSARAEADRVFAALTREAADARRRTATEHAVAGSWLLLDAAFLVPTSRTRAFRAAVNRHARQAGSGVLMSLTGPWPPYNFVTARQRNTRAKPRD